jgi:hypothetical protein
VRNIFTQSDCIWFFWGLNGRSYIEKTEAEERWRAS